MIKKRPKIIVKMNPIAPGQVATMAAGQLEELAENMVYIADEFVPRDTGNLARSITHDSPSELSKRVYTETGYGAFVELGTSKQQAQPYLAPAYQQAANDLARKYPGVWRPK